MLFGKTSTANHLSIFVCANVQEKGTTPLHVAAKAGQVLQAELLVVYGADPGAPDINGRTPIDYARCSIPLLMPTLPSTVD